jgi:4-amino-4-deoxy-L-arabinose transferase-like glycosyltransferase
LDHLRSVIPSTTADRAAGQRAALPPALQALAAATALLGLCWLAFFNGLGALGLMDKTEALFVEVGHQMLLSGDWVTPHWNGVTFFDYPVWGYWMVALSFKLFGVTAWAARLPVALAASTVVVATFGLLWRLAPAGLQPVERLGRGLLGAAVLATTPAWIGWARSSTTDMFLSSAITLALYGFALVELAPSRPGRQAWEAPLGRAAMALFAGIAVLAKGPVGLLLPGMVIVVFLALRGGWSRWLRPLPLLAMALLFLGVTAPWYGAAAAANGMAFIGGFLGFSNIQRFTSVLYDHPGPPWFYLPWVMLLVLPWSLLLPLAIARTRFWRWSLWRDTPAAEALPQLLLVWLVVIVAFFSAAATKLPGYVLPAIPAASLLVAQLFGPSGLARRGWPLHISAAATALLLSLAAAAAVLAPGWVATDPAYPRFGEALRSSGLPVALALVLAAMALVCWWLLARGRSAQVWVPNLAGFLALLAFVIAPLAPLLDRERQLPLRQIQALAGAQTRPAEPLWVVGTPRYSTLFYAGRTAVFIGDAGEAFNRLRSEPQGLGVVPATLSVLLLGDREHLEGFRLPPGAVQRLGQRGEQQLWRVQLRAFAAANALGG